MAQGRRRRQEPQATIPLHGQPRQAQRGHRHEAEKPCEYRLLLPPDFISVTQCVSFPCFRASCSALRFQFHVLRIVTHADVSVFLKELLSVSKRKMMQNLDIESVKKGLVDLFKEEHAGFESKQKLGHSNTYG